MQLHRYTLRIFTQIKGVSVKYDRSGVDAGDNRSVGSEEAPDDEGGGLEDFGKKLEFSPLNALTMLYPPRLYLSSLPILF